MLSVDFGEMAIWLVAFLFSVTAHEAAHAYFALRGGDPTAYLGGQVTMNPIPHIQRSPFGMLVVPFLSFAWSGFMIGWASAPYDPNWAHRYPRRAAWMAAAGPAANLAIFTAAFIIAKIGLHGGLFSLPAADSFSLTGIIAAESAIMSSVAKLLSVFLVLNLILFVFNLFPFPPLDGSSVITLFMPEPTALKYTAFISQPMYSLLGLVIAWRFFGMVFIYIFRIIVQILYAGV
jgi:Zn-dependent protease